MPVPMEIIRITYNVFNMILNGFFTNCPIECVIDKGGHYMSMPVIQPGTISREDAIGNIIESIAMEESSLSHILNAESEKIMAVVENPNATAEELLSINRSVKSTISSITRLESILLAKLDLFQPIICE